MKNQRKTVAWFSGGVSSAVAVKLASGIIDEIIFIEIEDHHPDTERFINECELWFGKSIQRLKSPLSNVENAVRMAGGRGYINGTAGASCTRLLKRRVRKEWEILQKENIDYVWGFDMEEGNRADRVCDAMRENAHYFPLIEKALTKSETHKILKASGIKRPAMYDLGYNNNNCVGCVKGGMGYWNKIRIDFPDIFTARSELERLVGASCIKDVYLDELEPSRGHDVLGIVEDCGIFCELMKL